MQGANIYTVEGVIISAVGFAWYEGVQSLRGVSPPLEQLIFQGVACAACVNLFLCTLPLNSAAVQRHFFSMVLAFFVAYTFVASVVISNSGKGVQYTSPGNAGNYTLSQAYAALFLGDSPPWDPLLPYVGMGGTLAILCVQTLVAAAAVSPNLWDSRVTGPMVMIALCMCSEVRSCVWPGVLALIAVVALEVLTSVRDTDAAGYPKTLLAVTAVCGTCQLVKIGIESYLSYRVLTTAELPLGTLIVGGVGFGIPFIASWVTFVTGLVKLKTAADGVLSLKSEASSTFASNTACGLGTSAPPQSASRHTLRTVVPASDVGTLQTAFHTSEASLFRPSTASGQWAPKKVI